MKKNKIFYWIFTGLVSLAFAASGLMYLFNPAMTTAFGQLGFPAYFVPLLGVGKIGGALAIINPWSSKLKEWAYAGFTFTLIGAVWTHVATNSPAVPPLIFLALLAVSYVFYLKVKGEFRKVNISAPAFS